MTISLDAGTVRLTGACGVEEAEALVTFLASQPESHVDVSGATSIHTSLWQTLMVFRPHVTGNPAPSSSMDKIFPALNAYLDEGAT